MSVQTAKKVAWKKYKVAVPQDTDTQTCYPPLGECMFKCIFRALWMKGSSHQGLFLSSVQAALTDLAQVC